MQRWEFVNSMHLHPIQPQSFLPQDWQVVTYTIAALQEVGILKGLNYDRNVIQFYGACLQLGRDPMLVCEYMEGGHSTQLHMCLDSHTLQRQRFPTRMPLQWRSTQTCGLSNCEQEATCARR